MPHSKHGSRVNQHSKKIFHTQRQPVQQFIENNLSLRRRVSNGRCPHGTGAGLPFQTPATSLLMQVINKTPAPSPDTPPEKLLPVPRRNHPRPLLPLFLGAPCPLAADRLRYTAVRVGFDRHPPERSTPGGRRLVLNTLEWKDEDMAQPARDMRKPAVVWEADWGHALVRAHAEGKMGGLRPASDPLHSTHQGWHPGKAPQIPNARGGRTHRLPQACRGRRSDLVGGGLVRSPEGRPVWHGKYQFYPSEMGGSPTSPGTEHLVIFGHGYPASRMEEWRRVLNPS